MTILYSVLIFILPLISLILLLSAKSETRRRTGLLSVACSLCISGYWYFLVRWGLQQVEEIRDAYPQLNLNVMHLFEGRGGALLAYFFSDLRLAAVYALSIMLAAYFANQRVKRQSY